MGEMGGGTDGENLPPHATVAVLQVQQAASSLFLVVICKHDNTKHAFTLSAHTVWKG